MMQLLAVVVAGFVVSLAVTSVRNRRSIRGCCARDVACDLRMRDTW